MGSHAQSTGINGTNHEGGTTDGKQALNPAQAARLRSLRDRCKRSAQRLLDVLSEMPSEAGPYTQVLQNLRNTARGEVDRAETWLAPISSEVGPDTRETRPAGYSSGELDLDAEIAAFRAAAQGDGAEADQERADHRSLVDCPERREGGRQRVGEHEVVE